MIETDDEKYYGVLEDIIELIYPRGVTIVVFKCRWFNENRSTVKRDRGLESVDTSQSFYEDTPYCLASLAKQVFYVDDPKLCDNWRVVNVVFQRGTFNANSLAREDDAPIDNAYQEDATRNIPQVPIQSLSIDFGSSLPSAPPECYTEMEIVDDEDESEDDVEDESEEGFEYDDEDDDF